MSTRHKIERYYSIKAIVNNKIVNLDISTWNGTASGLAKTTHAQVPDWELLNVSQTRLVIDTVIGKTVDKKLNKLQIARIGHSESLCTKVDENLTKNGRIPANILSFFGEYTK